MSAKSQVKWKVSYFSRKTFSTSKTQAPFLYRWQYCTRKTSVEFHQLSKQAMPMLGYKAGYFYLKYFQRKT